MLAEPKASLRTDGFLYWIVDQHERLISGKRMDAAKAWISASQVLDAAGYRS